jgi:serralysin
LGYVDVYSADISSTYTLTVNLSGAWSLSTLRFSSEANIRVVISDAASPVAARHIETLILNGNNGGSKVTLTQTSIDLIQGGRAVDAITVGSGAITTIDGRDGNDVFKTGTGYVGSILGGNGNDTLTTGAGNIGAVVMGEGNDTVTLGSGGVESIATGGGNDTVTGTSGQAGIVDTNAGDGADKIDLGSGGASAVSLSDGDDAITLSMLDFASDKVMIDGGSGSDAVSFARFDAGVAISLASSAKADTGKGIFILTGFENVTGGAGSDLLTGNSGANVIDGGKGNDTIRGYAGSDTLTGWAGIDTFVFNTALNVATNVDTITDFSVVADTIELDNAIFTALTATGPLAPSAFKDMDAGPIDASDRIIYKLSTGNLYYDADGSGAASASVKFAQIANHATLTAADFVVI